VAVDRAAGRANDRERAFRCTVAAPEWRRPAPRLRSPGAMARPGRYSVWRRLP
jgi:hypothetical protein